MLRRRFAASGFSRVSTARRAHYSSASSSPSWRAHALSSSCVDLVSQGCFFSAQTTSPLQLTKLFVNYVRHWAFAPLKQPESQPARVIGDLEVLTPPDRPAGRHLRVASVPLKETALADQVPVHEAPSDWTNWKVPVSRTGEPFSMAVVVSFGYLIPTHVLDYFQFRAINMHPSLLPRYRGAAPIHHTILQRDAESGVSIIQLSANKFDAGKILLQRKMSVPSDIQYAPLAEKLAELGAVAVADVLSDFEAKLRNAVPQNDALVTKAPKVRKQDGVLRFDRSAEEAHTRSRAFNDNIGIHAWAGGKRLRVRFLNLALDGATAPAAIGEMRYQKDRKLLHITCQQGGLSSNRVQVAGKAAQSAAEFANGYLKNGASLQLYETA